MTLYLHSSITAQTIADAAAAGIVGVKAYPAGVTTNSQDGVLDLQSYYHIFEAMQTHHMVLNLHGEVPSTPSVALGTTDEAERAVTVLNAEPMFLPTLHKLHAKFPDLRIVLEHCSTRQALEAVRACGPTVAATITAHHLWMTVDNWCGDVFNFCKPVAKTPADRVALVQAVVEQGGKFFFGMYDRPLRYIYKAKKYTCLGSDSAPHTIKAKTKSGKPAAGCFTQQHATQLVVAALEEGQRQGWVQEDITPELLRGFLRDRGRKFYKIEDSAQGSHEPKIVLEKKGKRIPASIKNRIGSVEIAPFRSGEEIWSLKWE